MVKLIIGLKGSGKTKTLIEMVNTAANTSHGSVICVEKGNNLRFDVNYQARLVDVADYSIETTEELSGFVCGMYASNHDITHVFIDAALKMCKNDVSAFTKFFLKIAKFANDNGFDFVATSSIDPSELPSELKEYV